MRAVTSVVRRAGWVGWPVAPVVVLAHLGLAVLAGALLKLADLATPAAVAAVNPKGSLPARIAQLEGEPRLRRPRLGPLRAGASLASVSALLVTGMCCAGMASSVLAGSGA